jgi:hypothetical protein
MLILLALQNLMHDTIGQSLVRNVSFFEFWLLLQTIGAKDGAKDALTKTK